MRARRFLPVGLIALATSGCLAIAPSPPRPLIVDVSGTWTGGWWNNFGGGPVGLRLQQSDGRVTGTMDMAGAQSYCGLVEGALDGEVLTLRATGASSGGGPSVELRVRRDDAMDGQLVYVVTSTTMSLNRQWPALELPPGTCLPRS